jgi:hypothetical protein
LARLSRNWIRFTLIPWWRMISRNWTRLFLETKKKTRLFSEPPHSRKIITKFDLFMLTYFFFTHELIIVSFAHCLDN